LESLSFEYNEVHLYCNLNYVWRHYDRLFIFFIIFRVGKKLQRKLYIFFWKPNKRLLFAKIEVFVLFLSRIENQVVALPNKTEENLMRKENLFTTECFTDFGKLNKADGGSILGSSQFTQLSQLSLKIMFDLKMVKIDSKIIILLR